MTWACPSLRVVAMPANSIRCVFSQTIALSDVLHTLSFHDTPELI